MYTKLVVLAILFILVMVWGVIKSRKRRFTLKRLMQAFQETQTLPGRALWRVDYRDGEYWLSNRGLGCLYRRVEYLEMPSRPDFAREKITCTSDTYSGQVYLSFHDGTLFVAEEGERGIDISKISLINRSILRDLLVVLRQAVQDHRKH